MTTIKRKKFGIVILGIILLQVVYNSQLILFDKFNQTDPIYEDNNIKTKPKSSSTLIFEDDFESYPVNTFPTGYTLVYSGSGASNQKIINTQSVSGSKSFTLHGVGGSLARVTKAISYTSDIITLEANLMSETPTGVVQGGQANYNILIAFANPSDSLIAYFELRNDGNINLGATGKTLLGTFSAFTWYNLRMILNVSSWVVKAYLNDTYVGESTTSLDPSTITQVLLGSGHQGIVGYIDDLICSEGPLDYINIITPLNKTYSAPMTGYYPATYGFEGDPDGILPPYMIKVDPYPISVYGSRNGRNKVLWFDDNGYSFRASCKNNFSSNINSGTIEFWFLVDDAYDRTGMGIQHDTGQLVNFGSRYDKWKYANATVVDLNIQKATGGDMDSPLDNTWSHVRIDFEATTGNYMGLDQYSWKCWIDGIESAPMPFFSNEIFADNFYMGTSSAHTSYNLFIDAIGYSWDPNYNVGDNLNEGLLVSYDSDLVLDWMGYSLNGQPNKTIIGNTTLTMPSYGVHTIRMFGNDSLGVRHQSDLRYFNISYTNNNNNKPILSGGFASPLTGDQNTKFTFQVLYSDLDDNPPSFINVIINGSSYQMYKANPADNNFTDGCLYQYSIYLVPSNFNYSYNFESSDSIYYNATAIFNNLKVNKVNNYNPYLTSPQLSPLIGNYQTLFNFTVWYFDSDNNYPAVVNMTINNTVYVMSQADIFDKNATNGIQYFLNTTLAFGYYQFQMNCSDGEYKNSTGWINGPEVNPFFNISDILLLAPSNNSVIFNGWFNFTWNSLEQPYGLVNYTFQISNTSDFSYLFEHIEYIEEKPLISNVLINVNYQNDLYWRVRPTYDFFIGNWSKTMNFVLSTNNFKPVLLYPSVNQTIGYEYTFFNFTVSYFDQDNNSPLFIDVIINGTSYAMEKINSSDNNYTDGNIYQYLTLLPISNHNYTYSFNCSDGKYSNSTVTFNNLMVINANYFGPQLVNPQISPDTGGFGTTFNFTVWYYDSDNTLPKHINITINQTLYLMQPVDPLDTISTDGILYYFNTTLDFGSYQFQINCSDGLFKNSTSWIFGPEVNPFLNINAVTLLAPINNEELQANLINFSWTSIDAVFSGVNFTFQLSALSNFSTLLYEFTELNDMVNITFFPLNVNLPSGLYYWRVRPTYGRYYGDWSNYFQLNILRNSFAPQLESHSISALTGNQKTIFKFTVNYKDLDNNRPTFVRIIINGNPFYMEKMNPNDNDYTDGCTYQFLSLLTPSLEAYSYSFESNDGIFTFNTLTFTGPLITSDIQSHDGTTGLNNKNSENIFVIVISSVIGFGIVVPSILVTEVKVKKIKSHSVSKPKFGSKLKKIKKLKK